MGLHDLSRHHLKMRKLTCSLNSGADVECLGTSDLLEVVGWCKWGGKRQCASEDVHDFTLVYFGRKFLILCPTIWSMAQSSKRKTKASGSFSSDSDICSPERKKTLQ